MAKQPPPTPSELLRMVTELRQAVAKENQRMEEEQPEHNEEAQKDIENDNQESSAGPFTAEVMNFVLPRRFTLLTTLTPYDGLGDPKKYIKKFTSIMIVNGSISRFRDISKPFEEHFAGSAIYLHDSDYLNTVKQGQHESLKDYMTRFTKIAMSIPDLHPEVELHAIKSELRLGKFQESIAVAKPKTMAEFREKAKGQIDIKELRQARKRDDIIKEILNLKLIKPPRKAGNYPDSKGTDRSKYCSFHQKHGHNIDDCVIAKDLLERLTRQGHLDKYISGHMQRRAPPSGDQSSVTQHGQDRPNNSHPELPTRTINCISGGFAGGGATSSARKRSYQAIFSISADQSQQQPLPTSPQITFQTADHDNSVANLDDPVVISLQLGDLLVKKVLLDPGSSADVLFYSTLQKMKLSNNVIQPSTGDLDNTIATIHSDAREARECYNNSLKTPNRNTKA
ncbi:uncharacterized protein LOC107619966 [Arachis ipaensis]|uniref:uncharacterized protein LOC107619966 n=1 Tax=Arachis ipaensis TaxID=130454 RepID=UPI0007AF4578|nr:uncharacterized protein LOC107619966 [Arachis ipaensis]